MGESEFPELPEALPSSNEELAPSPLPVPPRVRSRKVFGQIIFLSLVIFSAAVGALAGLVFVYSSDLPQVRQLEDYRPDVMTEIYADDGALIGSFAMERRVIVSYNQIPPMLRDAVLSIEDRHFENHWGIDVYRIVRAGITDLLEWRKAQGASTLTQQLSRMLFLTPEKNFRRKFQEVLLAIQIERRFTKPQIFTMYANQVGLGHGNYGFEAAAQFFFGKHLNQLTLPEAALLAGLPRTPTAYSPILHPERALQRRNQVLLAMLENGKITETQYREAKAEPLSLNIQRWNNTIAPYFVEDARQLLEKKYGMEAVHEKGLRVYTTLNPRLQAIAEQALRHGIEVDDKRRGWRGPEANILKGVADSARRRSAMLEAYAHDDWKKPLQSGSLVHGLVTEVKPDHALVRFGKLSARITPPDFAWTQKAKLHEVFSSGDVDLFLVKDVKGQALHAVLDQRPDVQGALVAIENSTGAIIAMVGGYSFEESKFNRAHQAERQAGSSFKVYVYSQALLDGASPFDVILDAPVSYPTPSGVWSPHNYDFKFEGPITLLHALAESRNVPAVRLLSKVGIDKVIKLCRRFGITSRLFPNLPLALGASDLTLLEHTSAFTTFPNDGVRISPRMIQRVTDYDGRLVDDFPPEVSDVLPAAAARLMVSMLRESINSGTAIQAKPLAAQRPLAGKTGTTNEFSDAWFLGFSPTLTCGVWVGFDDHRSLGPKEEGARVALPIWMQFMDEALRDRPVENFSHSPLLINSDQVKEIMASAGPEQLVGEAPPAAPPGAGPLERSSPDKRPSARDPISRTVTPAAALAARRRDAAVDRAPEGSKPSPTPSETTNVPTTAPSSSH